MTADPPLPDAELDEEPTYGGYRYRHPQDAKIEDPELIAIGLVIAALDNLDRGARKRVLRWAWARYVPPTMFDSAPGR